MKEIKLTQRQVALVDDNVFEYLNQWKWQAYESHTKNKWYATRGIWIPQKKRMTTIQMHRIIMNAHVAQQIDHINHNGLDNRKENLRFCTHLQNQWNSKKRVNGLFSRYKGLSKHLMRDGKRFYWRARIGVNGKNISLGLFHNEQDAANAYDNAAMKYFGEFAFLNRSMVREAA